MKADFRVASPVLVTDAQTMGALGVIRSLGRAGYPVVAASHRDDALGLRSRYVHSTLRSPDPVGEAGAVADWLRAAVERTGAVAVVPSEAVLLAIEADFEEFSPLLPFGADAQTVYDGMSKVALFRTFDHERGRRNLPRFRILDEQAVQRLDHRAFADWCHPLFAKVDASRARVDAGDRGGQVVPIPAAEQCAGVLRTLVGSYHEVLVQEFSSGVGVGVFLLRWQGRELAHFLHRRLHEVPHTGGASSYRRAFRHEAMLEDARWRAEELGWEGVAMFEYRWDPASDRFELLEMNGRFWGSLHLALYAGVDFPRLLLDAFLGHPEEVADYRDTVRCRHTFPRDVEYVLSIVRDARVPVGRRFAALVEFPWLFLDPRVRSDLWFPGDRGLYLRSIAVTVRKFLS